MQETARRAFVATLVALAVVLSALALWKLKAIIALLFLAFIIAAAMRPGVDKLARRRVPRPVGVLLHYAALVGLVALFLWLVVPRALDQVQQALGTNGVPTSTQDLKRAAKHTTGIRHKVLVSLQHRLQRLKTSSVVSPAIDVTLKVFEAFVGIFFTFAAAAYWIFERDRAIGLVLSLLPRRHRKVVRDTWDLIDLKLGAFVRGELLLIVLVATLLSLAFWAIGLPYWLLVGVFAGIVELIPVVGPLAAGGVAVAVGATQSWHTAVLAGIAVLAVRLLEDYIVIPRVLGHAVGLSPLLVLVSVVSITVLFGGFAVLFAVPFAAVLATLVDVIVRGRDPAQEEVPTVLFGSGKESEVAQ
jgi:predicted PurR-regulated permease PerM